MVTNRVRPNDEDRAAPIDLSDGPSPRKRKLVCRIFVVLGWHYTNTPIRPKGQVMAILDGSLIGLAPQGTRRRPSPLALR